MRVIEGDVLWEKLDDEPWYDNADRVEIALPIVAAAPTVDAVVVTRCKDCKHSALPSELPQRYGKPGILTCHNRYSPCNRRNVGEDDFCSYGEPKESKNADDHD